MYMRIFCKCCQCLPRLGGHDSPLFANYSSRRTSADARLETPSAAASDMPSPLASLLPTACLLFAATATNLDVQLNPGCRNCSAQDYLVYAKSSFSDGSCHFVWSSLANDDPAFLLVHSSNHSSADIDMDRLDTGSSDSLKVSGVVNDIAVVVRDVLLWNDTQKAGTFNQSEARSIKELKEIVRSNETLSNSSAAIDASFVFADQESELEVVISLSAGTKTNRFVDLPHLLMTPTSFHVQVVVQGDPMLNFTNCRVILDLEVYHREGAVNVVSETTIDDEFSPGVFSRNTATVDSQPESFLQWKPVGYNKADRIIAHTVDNEASISNTSQTNTTSNNKVVAGYSSRDPWQVSYVRFTFGAAKDTFYTEYKYTDFSFVVGLGKPEQESLSFLVQLIIWIGFGVPLLALIAAAAYLGVRRTRRRRALNLLLQD